MGFLSRSEFFTVAICGNPRFIAVLLGVFLLMLPPQRGHSADLDQLIGPSRASLLIRDGHITEAQFRNPRPQLLPNHEHTQALFDQALAELEPGLLVESLFLYQKPEVASPGQWSEAERVALYNRTVALSSLTGLQYFSTSRNQMRTFYERSMVIDSPNSQQRQSDPVYAVPPAEITLYAQQRDLTFGDNTYRYTYYSWSEAEVFVQENLTALHVGIVPAIGKEKLRSIVAIIDAGPFLLIYICSMARATVIPGVNQRLSASFTTRSEALMNWFSAQADKAYGGDPDAYF